jgi:hypothetical protein
VIRWRTHLAFGNRTDAPQTEDDRSMKTTTQLTAGPAALADASRVRGGSVCAMPWYGIAAKRFVGFASDGHTARTRRPEEVPR